jgi:pimeloyl-ACP methyl ester carboxylesterase
MNNTSLDRFHRPYEEEIVYAESEDGLDLAGVSIRPVTPTSSSTILWIHGNTGHFYEYGYVMLGRALAAIGHSFLAVNTRGHDVTAFLWNIFEEKRVSGGSAWERLEAAPHDIAGWIAAAEKLGAGQVILAGHSQGAAKVLLYQAERTDSRVQGIVLASPDLHGHWSADVVSEAHRLVKEGFGDELMPPLMNAPAYRLSAANVGSRDTMLKAAYYGERPYLSEIYCPIFTFYGMHGDVGGSREIETIRSLYQSQVFRSELIEGADHMYFGQHEKVAQLISEWIQHLGTEITGT